MKELVVLIVFSLLISLNFIMYDLIYDIKDRRVIKMIIILSSVVFISSVLILIMVMILKEME